MTPIRSSRTGTVVIEGLIEGPVPPLADGEERLRAWATFARESGLPFELSVDGPSFSLLADGQPLRPERLDNLGDTLRQAVEQLLEVFPEDLRGRIFSTIRSTEYHEHTKLESVYAITSRGVRVAEKKTPWEDEPAPAILPPRRSLPYIVAAVVVAMVLTLSAFVIDYSALLRGITTRYLPLDPAIIEVDGASVSAYLTLEKAGIDATGAALVLIARRTAAFPTELAAYRAEEERVIESGSMRDLIALRKLVVDGSLRLDLVDKDGKIVTSREESVRGLLESETIRLLVPLRNHPGAVKVRLGY